MTATAAVAIAIGLIIAFALILIWSLCSITAQLDDFEERHFGTRRS